MIPWIQVYSNLPQHPKTTKLADELGLASAALDPNVLAVGLVVSLWSWAIQNAHNGDLSGCSARAIAGACQWKKKPETLVKALQKAGFLDEDMKLHDWEEYACLLMEQEENRRAKTRERVKRYRDRKAEDGNAPGNAPCNVTDTPCNAPTIPDHTIPNQTKPNIFSVDDDARTRAQEEIVNYCSERDLDMTAYFGASEEVQSEVAAVTDALFTRLAFRPANQHDAVQVFHALRVSEHDQQTDTWQITLPFERKQLLMYAFEAACYAGCPGNWRYINAILEKLHQRGITSLEEAEAYDFDRR